MTNKNGIPSIHSSATASHLFEHDVAVVIAAEFDVERVTGDGESGLFVLFLVSVLQLQSVDLLMQPVVLWNLQLVRPCRQKTVKATLCVTNW